ncbi:hypothetical protein ACFOZ1_15300 [Gracilibacillus marinus]|uniref:Phage-related protein n=1 Tax=Gracilibacillus marinus TaxID=630535 RepID=A0ABV8VX88_9BACI
MQIFKLFGSILIDDKEAQSSLSKTDKQSKNLGDRLKGTIKTAAKWGAAIVTGAGVAATGMTALALKVGRAADELLDIAAVTGMTTEEIQRWRKATEEAGTSTDAVANASAKFTKSLDAMSEESNKGNEALKKLGLSFNEVENMSADERMNVLTEALTGVEDKTERARLGTDLFGGSWKDLAPVIDLGAEAMKNAKDNANVFSDEDLVKANEFRMMYDQMTEKVKFFGMQIGMSLMPILSTMFSWFESAMPTIQSVTTFAFDKISGVISNLANGIQGLYDKFRSYYESNQETLQLLWESFQVYLGFILEYWKSIFTNIQSTIQEFVNFILPYIATFFEALLLFWQENGQLIIDSAKNIFGAIQSVVSTVFGAIFTIIQEILSLVLPFIQEKLALLQQFWQENGQQIMQAVQNAFKFIENIIKVIMPIVLAIIKVAWESIKGVINGALNIIMGLIKVFSGLFTGDFSKMWEGIKQIFKGALEFIWNFINLTLIGRGLGLIKNFASMAVNLFRNLGTGAINIFRNLGSSAVNIVSNFIKKILNFFTSMKTGATNTVTGLFSSIKNTFNNILSFITGLGGSFLKAGKGLIEQMVKGVKNSISLVTDTISNVAGKVRDFLPFSPAKVGPLSDLDKLDFEGPIADSIDHSEEGIQGKMERLLKVPKFESIESNARNTIMKDDNNSSYISDRENIKFDTSILEKLLIELIKAVREGKEIILNDKVLAKETAEARSEYDGKTVRHAGRRLAT